MRKAGKLAADRGVSIHAITVVEVPVELPLDAEMPREERGAEQLLAHARQIAEEYGATVETKVVHGRQAGRAIVDEARHMKAEVIMMGVARKRRLGERIFGRTVDYVLHHADCRVVVATDHARIVAACQAHHIDVVLTRTDHPSGSDRLAEACDLIGLTDTDVVVMMRERTGFPRKVIEAPGECRENHYVISELAKRLGAKHRGFGMTAWEIMDEALKASGMWDAETNWQRGGQDFHLGFATALLEHRHVVGSFAPHEGLGGLLAFGVALEELARLLGECFDRDRVRHGSNRTQPGRRARRRAN